MAKNDDSKMNWIKSKKEKPNHKDLVLCRMKGGVIIPAIYYNNDSFKGFYPFTTYYTNHIESGFYSKVETKIKFKNTVEWMLIPE
jgi:hypothetical protein